MTVTVEDAAPANVALATVVDAEMAKVESTESKDVAETIVSETSEGAVQKYLARFSNHVNKCFCDSSERNVLLTVMGNKM